MTADAAEIVRLAERVEQCREGGLFSLDSEIAYALGLPLEGIAKPYTASLDAAMTLVGDHCWRVEDHPLAGPCALVDDVEGYAATPVLALVAAALRARAQHDNEVG